MAKFSPVREIPRAKIGLRPDLFQNRAGSFSQESVNKIVEEGFDKSQDPIIVWKDETGLFLVISGHSRWHASEILYKNGDKSLKTMPVKEFQGTFKEAQNYALLESNRSGTAEGLKADIRAYKRAVKEGYKKSQLVNLFKSESAVRFLRALAELDAKGRFLEYLDTPEEKSFPYLRRNAEWAGTLRQIYPLLTDAHEAEIFAYCYHSDKGLKISKEALFDQVGKKAVRKDFDQSAPLGLQKGAAKKADATIEDLTERIAATAAERLKQEERIVYYATQGDEANTARALEKEERATETLVQLIDKKVDIE